MLKPQNGIIAVCSYCGEQVGNKQKFCSICRTKDGRKSIFEANAEIFKENAKLGFTVPTSLKNFA